MKTFAKKYQLWMSMGETFNFQEFDTLQECITAPHAGDWYVTKRVSLSVTDAEEQPLIIPQVPYVQPRAIEAKSEPDPAEELAAKYAAGPVGSLNESGLP